MSTALAVQIACLSGRIVSASNVSVGSTSAVSDNECGLIFPNSGRSFGRGVGSKAVRRMGRGGGGGGGEL